MGQAKIKADRRAALLLNGFSDEYTAAHEVSHAIMSVLVGHRVKELDIHILPSPVAGRSKKVPSSGERMGATRRADTKQTRSRGGVPNLLIYLAGGIGESMFGGNSPIRGRNLYHLNVERIGAGATSDLEETEGLIGFWWGDISDEQMKRALLLLSPAVREILTPYLPLLKDLTRELVEHPKGRLRGGRVHEAVAEFHKRTGHNPNVDEMMLGVAKQLGALLGAPRFPLFYKELEDGRITWSDHFPRHRTSPKHASRAKKKRQTP